MELLFYLTIVKFYVTLDKKELFVMIVDVLSNSDKYVSLHKDFKLVFDYIKNNNLKGMECGKHEIRGDEVFFNLQEYETKPLQKLEAHKKYTDIQLVVDGYEYMGYTNINNTGIKEAYISENDVMFLTSDRTDKIFADDKTFVIFFPQDAHMPALSGDNGTNHVKKAVFKILPEQ